MFTIETFTPQEIEEMSSEALEKYNQKLMAGRESLKLESQVVMKELSRRASLAKFNAMSDEEKAALVQYVKVHAIGSAAKVSSPGA